MTKTYRIEGIYCAMGVVKIQKKLKTVAGVDDAKFDLKTCIATVEGNPQDNDIFDVIKEAGCKL